MAIHKSLCTYSEQAFRQNIYARQIIAALERPVANGMQRGSLRVDQSLMKIEELVKRVIPYDRNPVAY